MKKILNDKKWIRSLPNQLTLFRMAVVPVLLVLFPLNIKGLNVFCAVLFMLAALTDYFDGMLARHFSVESRLGAIMDPVADKTLVGASLILIAANGALWTWMAGLLLCREIGMSGLRLVALEQGFTIDVSNLGKWKTFFLDVAVVCLMVNEPLFGWPFREVGMIAIWTAFAFSMYSAWLYLQSFLSKIKI